MTVARDILAMRLRGSLPFIFLSEARRIVRVVCSRSGGVARIVSIMMFVGADLITMVLIPCVLGRAPHRALLARWNISHCGVILRSISKIR